MVVVVLGGTVVVVLGGTVVVVLGGTVVVVVGGTVVVVVGFTHSGWSGRLSQRGSGSANTPGRNTIRVNTITPLAMVINFLTIRTLLSR
jgi:hypothetical protein